GDLWEQLVAYHQALDPDLPAAAPNGGTLYTRRLIDRLDDPQTRVLVAVLDDGRVVGYALAVLIDLSPEMFIQVSSGFIADLFVDAACRGQGIGRALVMALRAWFAECGVQHFEWFVAAHNPAGRAFWQAMGGREIMLRMRVTLEHDLDDESESSG
ncbi:MAG: GNAT family N-acetyltransferase, partial [Armatimonadetes bacterium]|nr:GNAT family N-acetyltransferase [Anaerolineae bacterium]